jgi:hypothetical protein
MGRDGPVAFTGCQGTCFSCVKPGWRAIEGLKRTFRTVAEIRTTQAHFSIVASTMRSNIDTNGSLQGWGVGQQIQTGEEVTRTQIASHPGSQITVVA